MVILSPYANAFSGYITTQEEYQTQYYEGGHTIFGQWTLAAHQTQFDKVAEMFRGNSVLDESRRNRSIFEPKLSARTFSPEELDLWMKL